MIVLLPFSQVWAQKQDTAAVMMISRAQQHSILLRWGVNTPKAWKLANQYGYELWRFTIVRNGQVLEHPEINKLTPDAIRPAPLKDWEQISQTNSYAAIIAQALYGKDFEVAGGGNSGVAQIIAQSREQDQRFGLSLYAADNSFEAAKVAGWAFEDATVKQGEKYLYRVFTKIPVNKLRVDTGGVFTGLEDYKPLPTPPDIAAIFGDKHVMLSWNYNILREYYASWYVERSLDGKNFEKANNLPVTNLNEKEKRSTPRMYFLDSLKDNTTTYHYRVRGISPFGEVGPPSKTLSGKGRALLPYTPNIRSAKIDEHGVMTMTFEFDSAGNKLIKGFELNQSQTDKGPYTTGVQTASPDKRTLQYDKLKPSNYFTITAIALNGESATSFPVLVQPVDSTPPAAPQGLTAVVDSNGVVKISWQKNTEPDMLGYKIFRASNATEEMSPLVDTAFYLNSYTDTVELKSLNSKVYYTVAALDQRYNQSAFSKVLVVKKPDIVPPSSPIFTYYKVETGMVKLEWACSKDEDVAMHTIYRKDKADSTGKWLGIKQFTDTTAAYNDQNVTGGHTYTYLILAKDSSGLESPPAQPVTVFVPQVGTDLGIRSFSSYVNRDGRYVELTWSDKLTGVREYQLYKGEKGKMTLWKILPAGSRKIIDNELKINTLYEYGIRAIVGSGASGAIKTIEVKY